MDVLIPSGLINVITMVIEAIGTLAVIAVNHPFFLLVMVPLGSIYLLFQVKDYFVKYYVVSNFDASVENAF